MKRYAIAGATALALVLSTQAFAQSVAVEIAPEQRTRIKEYVVKGKGAAGHNYQGTSADRHEAPG